MHDPWWRSSIFYHVYVRSFLDSDGDGVGDLDGVRRRLDYVQWLGVDVLLLSPFYPSPLADYGYDVSDHCSVASEFGDLASFDRLVDDAHARGLRVIIDFVANHTSDRHPWFHSSRSSRRDPKRHWYIWRDGRPGGAPPNNWVAAFAARWRWQRDPERGDLRMVNLPTEGDQLGSAWTYDTQTGQYYLHLFLAEEPDVNWREPDLATAMHGIVRFWLDRGADGVRVDAAQTLGKDPTFAADRGDRIGAPRSSTNDEPLTHRYIRELRSLIGGYPNERLLLGEVYLLETRVVATYCGEDELHLAFDFVPLYTEWEASAWRRTMEAVEEAFAGADRWPTLMLSNHDSPRSRTRYGSEARSRAAAVLLLSARGTPFLYFGEELGLEDVTVPPHTARDPGGRDAYRGPMPWDTGDACGWPATPWLPWPPDPQRKSVVAQQDDPSSMLSLYRRLIRARRASPALTSGDLDVVDSSVGTLCWSRTARHDRRLVAVNFESTAVRPLDGAATTGEWIIDVSTVLDRGQWDGVLRPDEALILRPA